MSTNISDEYLWERQLSFVLKIILIFLALATLLKGEYTWFIGTLLSILLVFLPAILERDFNVKLPLIFDFAITSAISLHVVGGYLNFYEVIPFFDHITHLLSSVIISLLAVTLLYVLTYNMHVVKLPPVGFGVFTVFCAMSMGVFWEFMEWGIDVMAGTDFQRSLKDTMWDLVFDTLAGIVVGFVATTRLKVGRFLSDEIILEVGDVRNSVGYKRWKEMRKEDRRISANIVKSFKDPVIMETIIDHIVQESKHFTESQRKIWDKSRKPPQGQGPDP